MRNFKRHLPAYLFLCLTPAFDQQNAFGQQKDDIGSVGKYEINLFGGGSMFRQQKDAPQLKMDNGTTWGFRITQNYWRYVGIEEAFRIHGNNDIRLNSATAPQTRLTFDNHTRGFALGPVVHFTPRESRFRPFVKMGVGFNWFGPTDSAVASATNPAILGRSVAFKSELSPLFEYGAGFKFKANRRVGLRFDATGNVQDTPTFGIPSTGAANQVIFGQKGPLNGASITGGVTFYMGALAPDNLGDFTVGQLEGAGVSVWPGDPLNFKVPASSSIEGVTPKWTWNFNNAAQGTARGDVDSLALRAPDRAGSYEVKASIEPDQSGVKRRRVRNWLKKNPVTTQSRTGTITVKEWPAPSVSLNANPSSLSGPRPAPGTTAPVSVANAGTSTITSTASAFERPRELVYTFKTSEGRLTPGETAGGTVSQPDPRTVIVTLKDVKPGEAPRVTAIFTPDGIMVAPGTSKTVAVSVNVKDSHGPEASQTTNVTLSVPAAPPLPPPPPSKQPVQLDDIIFTYGRSRVNNCGKRVLDEIAQRAQADPDYDIVLIGHIDERESKIRRPRNAKALDMERILNAAAFLTAGTGTCKNVEPSRIKIMTAGTDQANESKALLCVSSTNERATDRVRANDANAKNRRVEVWLVPRPGKGPMPAGLNLQDLPTSELPKGCPR